MFGANGARRRVPSGVSISEAKFGFTAVEKSYARSRERVNMAWIPALVRTPEGYVRAPRKAASV